MSCKRESGRQATKPMDACGSGGSVGPNPVARNALRAVQGPKLRRCLTRCVILQQLSMLTFGDAMLVWSVLTDDFLSVYSILAPCKLQIYIGFSIM